MKANSLFAHIYFRWPQGCPCEFCRMIDRQWTIARILWERTQRENLRKQRVLEKLKELEAQIKFATHK